MTHENNPGMEEELPVFVEDAAGETGMRNLKGKIAIGSVSAIGLAGAIFAFAALRNRHSGQGETLESHDT